MDEASSKFTVFNQLRVVLPNIQPASIGFRLTLA